MGPDHYARLAAVAALLTAGRPSPKPKKEKDEEKGLITLDELKRMLDQQGTQEGGGGKEG